MSSANKSTVQNCQAALVMNDMTVWFSSAVARHDAAIDARSVPSVRVVEVDGGPRHLTWGLRVEFDDDDAIDDAIELLVDIADTVPSRIHVESVAELEKGSK